MNLDAQTMEQVIHAQRMEITEKAIYERLISLTKNQKNKQILEKIATQEQGHYNFLKSISGRDVEPFRFRIFYYTALSRVFGFTFGIRLMEREEVGAGSVYDKLRAVHPEVERIIREEQEHEAATISMLETKALDYAGSLVLGMNDALVEMTGGLAGLTLAIQNSKIIAVTGLVIGIAAAMSMASAEYLSSKEEKKEHPLTASAVTGIAYIITVLVLIVPYLIPGSIYMHLGLAIALGIFVIFLFNYYTSVMKNVSFKKSFLEMTTITLIVAAINFGIGYVVRTVFGIQI
jgi:VIT1/CCC1 family predicted Fe2+/Mn2+ transporter